MVHAKILQRSKDGPRAVRIKVDENERDYKRVKSGRDVQDNL